MEKENSIHKHPLYSIKALNYWRYFSIVVLFLIAIITFIFIKLIGFVIAILGIYCISMILFIRFPRIDLYENHFEILKRSIYNKLTVKEKYNYIDIKNVKFSKGFTNWILIMLIAFLNGGDSYYKNNEQYSKRDSMILVLADGNEIEISRIGNRDEFIKLIEQIKIKMTDSI